MSVVLPNLSRLETVFIAGLLLAQWGIVLERESTIHHYLVMSDMRVVWKAWFTLIEIR